MSHHFYFSGKVTLSMVVIGVYITSVFSETENAWVPDLNLGVAQGFVSEKRNAQNWVRVFTVN